MSAKRLILFIAKILYNKWKLKTIQVSINRCMDKWIVVYLHNGTLHSNSVEWTRQISQIVLTKIIHSKREYIMSLYLWSVETDKISESIMTEKG